MAPSRLLAIGAALVIIGAVGLAIGLIAGGKSSSDDQASLAISPRVDPLATSHPTVSMMPSPSPSISRFPSLRPSSYPTGMPSILPTGQPTLRPTLKPTEEPTTAPTVSPAPTPFPTQKPTANPTPAPTKNPTAPPIPPDYSFRLKLYWRKGYYWQEESFEKQWCLECAKCTPLTASGFGEGCEARSSGKCEKGDQFWLQKCKNSGNNAKFKIYKRDNKQGDLVQVANTNLCMERKQARYMALEKCDKAEPRQRWMGFRPNGQPFEWKPLDGRCVSQHHHPKAREVIYASECDLAHKWDTGLWEAL